MISEIRAVINADDLGLSPQVNDAVFELMAGDRITSATILANGPALTDALARLPQFPHCSFGLHLNATSFTPLSRDPGLAPLLRADGQFTNVVRSVRVNRRLASALAREFSCQIERLREAGVTPSHFDSHHHIHTAPALFLILKRLQLRYGIRRVRITRNLFPRHHAVPAQHRAKKAIWNFMLRTVVATRTTDVFGDLDSFVDQAPLLRRAGTAEIMVHPGNPGFSDEERRIRGEWWRDLPVAIRQISYRDL